jgi:hypothetical protein
LLVESNRFFAEPDTVQTGVANGETFAMMPPGLTVSVTLEEDQNA